MSFPYSALNAYCRKHGIPNYSDASDDEVSLPKLAGTGGAQNHAGGLVHKISDFGRFKRFLILGADSNTFYASANELTLQNAKVIVELLEANNGEDMVAEIVAVSQAGRAPRQSPGIFALAVILALAKSGPDNQPAIADSDKEKTSKAAKASATLKVRQAAMAAIPKVCRTASTLYELMAYYKALNLGNRSASEAGLGKWSYGLRKAICNWYLDRKPLDLAMQVSKYKTRNGISSRDLLRLAHPKASELGKRKRGEEEDDMQLVLKFAAHMDDEVTGDGQVSRFLRDCQRLKHEKDVGAVVSIIQQHNQISWEHVGESKLLKHPAIWAALLDRGMGLTALIRNLSRFLEIKLVGEATPKTGGVYNMFSGYGSWWADPVSKPEFITTSDSESEQSMVAEKQTEAKKEDSSPAWMPERDYLDIVNKRLTDKEGLVKGRIHPLRVLLAMVTLFKKFERPSLPQSLVTALEKSFELSFSAAHPTGKKFMIAMDVSSSMNCPCMGSANLTCTEATAAITTVLNRIEPVVKVTAFSSTLTDFPIAKTESLESVLRRTQKLKFGGTNCSLPIIQAIKKKLDIDVFIVMTDSETWEGGPKNRASTWLNKYRAIQAEKGRTEPAKLIVCAFSSTGFSIADPLDPGMLDVAGFDAALPEIIEDFVLGSYATSKL